MSASVVPLNARTPEGEWELAKVEAAELFDQACEVSGISDRALAKLLGLSHKRVGAMRDPSKSTVLVPIQVLWKGGKVGRELLRLIGSRIDGGARDNFGGDYMGRLTYALELLGQFGPTYAKAIADGHIDEQERLLILGMCTRIRRFIDGVEASLG